MAAEWRHEGRKRSYERPNESISSQNTNLQPPQQFRHAQNGHTPPQTVAAGQQTVLSIDRFQAFHERKVGTPTPFDGAERVFNYGLS